MFPFPFSFLGAATDVPLELIDNNFAMEFDGQSYVSAGNPTQLQMTGDISVSAWFKTSTNGGALTIVGRGAHYSGGASSWALFRRSANGIAAQLRTSAGYPTAMVNGSYFDGIYHHVAFTREVSSGNLKLYIDGALANTVTGITNDIMNQTQNTYIGADTVPDKHFIGDIDEVAIWNKALALEDVQTIYNATNDNPGKCANLFTGGLKDGLQYWNRMGDN